MSNVNLPFGFAPLKQTQPPARYVIKRADANPYRVGDAVRSADDADAAGVSAVTLASGSEAVRGVIVAIDPAAPANGLAGLTRLQVPAAKAKDYYVWVLDDPDAIYAIRDDGQVISNLIATNVGRLTNFLPNQAAAKGDTSTAVLPSDNFGSGSVLRLLGLEPGSVFAAFAVWRVKFALHELASDVVSAIPGGAQSFSGLLGSPRDNPSLNTELSTNATAAANAQATANAAGAAATTAQGAATAAQGAAAAASSAAAAAQGTATAAQGTATAAAGVAATAQGAATAASSAAASASAAATAAQSTANGKYSKPAGGIPSTDLSPGVQNSLAAANASYAKPAGGIPESDLDVATRAKIEAGTQGTVAPGQRAITGAFAFQAGDGNVVHGTQLLHIDGDVAACTGTIPTAAATAFPPGEFLWVVNGHGSSPITVQLDPSLGAAGVLTQDGVGPVASVTIPPDSTACFANTAANRWRAYVGA